MTAYLPRNTLTAQSIYPKITVCTYTQHQIKSQPSSFSPVSISLGQNLKHLQPTDEFLDLRNRKHTYFSLAVK